MSFVYFAIHYLPYWSLPLALIFGEVARIFKRRGRKKAMIWFGVLAGFFMALTVCFFVFSWGQYGYPAIREWLSL